MSSQKILVQVDVSIDLSHNATVREMFSNAEAGKKVGDFLKKHKIDIHSHDKNPTTGAVTHIELRGPAVGLLEFVKEFLRDDAGDGVVYTLLYKTLNITERTGSLIDVRVPSIAGAIIPDYKEKKK